MTTKLRSYLTRSSDVTFYNEFNKLFIPPVDLRNGNKKVGYYYSLMNLDYACSIEEAIADYGLTEEEMNILNDILGIADLRTSNRIDFVGGIRGLGELKKRVDSGEMKVAFALYPVSMSQLINIADSGNIMPPKTTWFEPKLRSGLAIHVLD